MPSFRPFAALATLLAAAACGAPSTQHAAQSADHSVQATGHSVAAGVTSTATVAAVPVIAAGSALAVTGAALEEVGTASVGAGVDVLDATLSGSTVPPCPHDYRHPDCVAPDGPPQLN